MTPPLRVTVVSPYAVLGGSERWLLSLLAETGRLDARVVLLQDGPLRARLEEAGVPVEVMATGTGARDMLGAGIRLRGVLRRHDPEVVLANGVKAALAAVPAARLLGVPVAWMKHDFSFDARLGPWLGRLSDAVLANSAAVAAATRRDDAVLVPPARPEEPALDRAAARRWWADRGVELPQASTMVMLGRLVAYKGVDTAVCALAAAPGWHLVVVGGDDPTEPGESARLRELAAARGVGDRVRFVGEVDEAWRALAAFDALAVLTRSAGGFGREGYSLAAIEALHAGVPVLGATGNPEVERMAALHGAVVDVDDAEAVAAGLQEVGSRTESLQPDGRPVGLLSDHPDAAAVADRVAAVLARTALRPGAGLAPEAPVSVLSCMRNEAGHVDGVVSAVVPQLREHDEYLLVDDGSTDGTREEMAAWAARDPRIRILDGPQVNLSAARNLGFGEARHAVVCCTDAGCTPAPDWLDRLRTPYAEAHADDVPAIVTGTYDVDHDTAWKAAARVVLFPDKDAARRATPIRRLRARLLGRAFAAHRVDGRSMGVAVTSWRAAGGFDVDLFSSEDAVFGYAVQEHAGPAVLSLDATVVWEQAETLAETAAMYRKYGQWGGQAGSGPLVARDLVRVAYFAGLPLLAASGRHGRRLAALGAGLWLGPPALSCARRGEPAQVVAYAPVVVTLKDLSKARGLVEGLVTRARRRRRG
ncbi:glycosyltransferase [Nocardioidaceae bacterium]|nr:glycosyltransferase [Nocardioidaceae bacterium]